MKSFLKRKSKSYSSEIQRHFKMFLGERILYSMLLAALGVTFILLPDQSGDVLCIIAGVLMLIASLVAFITFGMQRSFFSGLSLVMGILLAITGIYYITHPYAAKTMLNVLIGLVILMDAMIIFVEGIECADARIPGWSGLIIFSFFTLAAGLLVLVGDFNYVMYITGAALITDAVCKLISAWIFGRRIQKARKYLYDDIQDNEEKTDGIEDVTYEEL